MKILSATSVVVVLTAASAFAQERGQVGIAMGAPSNVLVIWHATDRVAVVPKISFSNNSTDSRIESQLTINGVVITTTTVSVSSDGWAASPGFDLRLRVGRWDTVGAYVAPGYTYLRSSTTTVTTTSSPFAIVPSETREFKTTGHDFRGVIGVQFTPHRKFAVFGEVGLRYTHSKQRLSNEITSKQFGNTSAVGATLYF